MHIFPYSWVWIIDVCRCHNNSCNSVVQVVTSFDSIQVSAQDELNTGVAELASECCPGILPTQHPIQHHSECESVGKASEPIIKWMVNSLLNNV
jgi:hypothetical protein